MWFDLLQTRFTCLKRIWVEKPPEYSLTRKLSPGRGSCLENNHLADPIPSPEQLADEADRVRIRASSPPCAYDRKLVLGSPVPPSPEKRSQFRDANLRQSDIHGAQTGTSRGAFYNNARRYSETRNAPRNVNYARDIDGAFVRPWTSDAVRVYARRSQPLVEGVDERYYLGNKDEVRWGGLILGGGAGSLGGPDRRGGGASSSGEGRPATILGGGELPREGAIEVGAWCAKKKVVVGSGVAKLPPEAVALVEKNLGDGEHGQQSAGSAAGNKTSVVDTVSMYSEESASDGAGGARTSSKGGDSSSRTHSKTRTEEVRQKVLVRGPTLLENIALPETAAPELFGERKPEPPPTLLENIALPEAAGSELFGELHPQPPPFVPPPASGKRQAEYSDRPRPVTAPQCGPAGRTRRPFRMVLPVPPDSRTSNTERCSSSPGGTVGFPSASRSDATPRSDAMKTPRSDVMKTPRSSALSSSPMTVHECSTNDHVNDAEAARPVLQTPSTLASRKSAIRHPHIRSSVAFPKRPATAHPLSSPHPPTGPTIIQCPPPSTPDCRPTTPRLPNSKPFFSRRRRIPLPAGQARLTPRNGGTIPPRAPGRSSSAMQKSAEVVHTAADGEQRTDDHATRTSSIGTAGADKNLRGKNGAGGKMTVFDRGFLDQHAESSPPRSSAESSPSWSPKFCEKDHSRRQRANAVKLNLHKVTENNHDPYIVSRLAARPVSAIAGPRSAAFAGGEQARAQSAFGRAQRRASSGMTGDLQSSDEVARLQPSDPRFFPYSLCCNKVKVC